MVRSTQALAARTFDVLIVGGGIHGAIAAWDAALRGLDVALVERSDFGAAASANNLRILHGGLRYLQTANFKRMRESIGERSTLMRLAPHLVRPLPFLVPTRGAGKQSRGAMGLALALADAVGFDRNRALPEAVRLPRGRVVSRRECLARFPALDSVPLSGGAVWYDGQLLEAERLTLSFLHAAAERGAVLANHVEARTLLVRGERVEGATVEDRPNGEPFDVRARAVLLTTGDATLLEPSNGKPITPPRRAMALAVNAVLRRRLSDMALGLRVRTPASRDPVCGGGRHVFLTPWRESTIVGTIYRPTGDLGRIDSERPESLVRELLDECNEVCPGLALSLDDVTAYHRGLVPQRASSEAGPPAALAESTRMLDHEEVDSIGGLVSLSGVKYTTARAAAEEAVDRLCTKLGRSGAAARTAHEPIYGGEAEPAPSVDPVVRRLAQLHGSRAPQLAQAFANWPGATEPLAPGHPVLRGEVLHAIRAEMAMSLADVMRRVGLAGEACPPRTVLEAAASLAAGELGWSASRCEREIDDVVAAYRMPAALGARP